MTDTDNLSRRRFLQATGGAASAVALAGCTGDTGEETTEESAGNSTDETEQVAEDLDGTYLRLTNSTMSTLDPIAATGTSEGQVIQQIHEPLMNYANATATVENRLATDYSVSDDLTTYTFELNEDATFHNGDDVTADDVVYSWERLAASDASKRAYFILDSIGVEHETTTETTDDGEEREVYKPGSLAVEAVDDYTIEMTISEPFHSVPEVIAYTSFAVIPEGIVGDIEGYDGEMEQGEFGKDPVGAGPFQFESWSPDTEAMVESFDDYHGTVPKVDGIHWNIVTDANARYNYAMNKNADYFPIPTNKFDPSKMSLDGGDANGGSSTLGSYGEIRNGETVNMVRTATIGNYYLGFNVEKVDKPVRQAFAYAANHQTLAEEVFKGTVKPASHFVPPAIFPGGATGYDEHAKDYPYGSTETRLPKAREVMEEAGYGEDNRAEVTITAYESSPVFQETARLLRDKLTSAHIDVTVDVAPFAAMRKQGLNGQLEVYTLGWIMDWPAPDNFLQLLNPPQTDTSSDAPVSYINWQGTDASERATEAWQTISENPEPTDEAQEARDEAAIEMEEANWEDVAMLTLFHDFKDRFWYDWVDIEPFGGAGPTRQMLNEVSVGERN